MRGTSAPKPWQDWLGPTPPHRAGSCMSYSHSLQGAGTMTLQAAKISWRDHISLTCPGGPALPGSPLGPAGPGGPGTPWHTIHMTISLDLRKVGWVLPCPTFPPPAPTPAPLLHCNHIPPVGGGYYIRGQSHGRADFSCLHSPTHPILLVLPCARLRWQSYTALGYQPGCWHCVCSLQHRALLSLPPGAGLTEAGDYPESPEPGHSGGETQCNGMQHFQPMQSLGNPGDGNSLSLAATALPTSIWYPRSPSCQPLSDTYHFSWQPCLSLLPWYTISAWHAGLSTLPLGNRKDATGATGASRADISHQSWPLCWVSMTLRMEMRASSTDGARGCQGLACSASRAWYADTESQDGNGGTQGGPAAKPCPWGRDRVKLTTCPGSPGVPCGPY